MVNIFQVCGSKISIMTRCAQLLQEQTDVDFIDLNVGCPIDRICSQVLSVLISNTKVKLNLAHISKKIHN